MCSLSLQQKEALFDYSLGLTAEQETAQVEVLIAHDKAAAEIHSKLEAVLAPLDALRPEPCPDDLIQRAFQRLMQMVNTEQFIKERGLIKSRFWRNLLEVVAIPMLFLFIAVILITSLPFGP